MVIVNGVSGPAMAMLDGAASAIPFLPTRAVPLGDESATPPSPATARPLGFAEAIDGLAVNEGKVCLVLGIPMIDV